MIELFRAVVPVAPIGDAVAFYERLLGAAGEWIGPGRVYFHGQGAILVCYDARAEGDGPGGGPNAGHLYFAVDDLDACFERARSAGCGWLEEHPAERAWGERSFYARDPFGNPLCFVDAASRYTGGESATAKKWSARPPGIALGASAARRRDAPTEEDP
jgi:uncharacterized glyoxalase superfamily protein PhnB